MRSDAYPAAIVIAMYYCLCRNSSDKRNLRGARWATISAFAVSVLQLLHVYNGMFGLGADALSSLYNMLPLSAYNLAWLPVCLILYVAGRFAPSAEPHNAPSAE